MNCHEIEGLIALYIEGDLEGRTLSRVLQHLGDCASCQQFAEELRASQRILKSLRDDPLNERVFQVLPERVTERIARVHNPISLSPGSASWYRWRWQALCFASMLVCVAALLVALRSREWVPDHRNLKREEYSIKRLQRSPNSADHAKLGSTSAKIERKGVKSRKSSSKLTDNGKSETFRSNEPREDGLPLRRRRTEEPIYVATRSKDEMEEGTSVPNVPLGPSTLTNPSVSPAWPSTVQTPSFDYPEPVDQMVIQLETDDPNIVIVWLIDQKRGKENAEN